MALGRLQEREDLPRLVAALEDDVHEVRRAAVRAIGILGDPAAVELLEEVVRDDEREGPLRMDAAVALGLILDEAVARPAAPNEPPPRPTWTGHDGGVTAVSVAGGVVLTAGADGRVLRHDPASGDAAPVLETEDEIADLELLPEGDRLAAAAGPAVSVVPLDGGAAHEVPVAAAPRALAVDPGRGERVAVGAADGAVEVVRIASGQQLSHAPGDGAAVSVLTWAPGGERVAAGAADGSVRVVFARSGRTLATLTAHTGEVSALLWPHEDVPLLAGGRDGRVVRWSGSSADDPTPWATLDVPVRSLARDPTGAVVAVGAEDGTIRVHGADGVERLRLEGPGGAVTALSFLEDGRTLVAGTAAGRLGPIPIPPVLFGDAPKPDDPPAPSAARSLALARLLAPESFFRLDSRARVGVAVGVGVTADPSLAAPTTALLRRKITLGSVVRGHLIAALAALGDPTRRDDLLEYLKDDDAHARRAAALGVGWLFAGVDDRDLLKHLRDRQRRDADVTIRNFLSISMGRIGGRYGVLPLLDALAESRSGLFGSRGVANAPRIRMGARSRTTFAALGVGLSKDPAGLEPLVERLREEDELSARAGIAVALGLAGDARAAKFVRKQLRPGQDPVHQGYLFLALGLLGDDAARDHVVSVLERENDQELLLRAALALHLNGDHAGERALVERLESERRPGARRAVLYALARTGGPGAVPALLAVLEDDRETAFVRRYAAVALGHVGSGRYVTRWSAAGRMFPYPAEPDALLDLLALP